MHIYSYDSDVVLTVYMQTDIYILLVSMETFMFSPWNSMGYKTRTAILQYRIY